ncbi:MAG: TA system VapC family ribonuclease toxin [Puniceicoccales bacterium]
MDLLDNNILIYALRPDSPNHMASKRWLEDSLNAGNSIRLFPTVEVGFIRVATHPKIFSPATPVAEAAQFLQFLCSLPTVEICSWTDTTRERWLTLCQDMGLTGNDCNDAMLAALCYERNMRLISCDKGFKRFPGLQLRLL